MSSIIRVVDCAYTPLRDQIILSVDVVYPDGSFEDRNYFVVASRRDIATEDLLQSYVERDICLQREAVPNWTGKTWRSAQV